MKISMTRNTITVEREPGDPGLSKGGYAGGWAPEHRVLYWVKLWVEREHFAHLVKTTVGADYKAGIAHHLMDDEVPYLRLPKTAFNKGGPWDVIVYHANYMVRSVADLWTDERKVVLNIVRNQEET